jgi:photosystem II stability/assembly factor-like uncharacterized protein
MRAFLCAIILTTLAAMSARAQDISEAPAAAPVDHSALSGSQGETEPLDRIAAQQALQGNYHTEAFKLNAIAELAKQQRLYPNQLAGATPPPGMPVWQSIGPTRDRYTYNDVTLRVIDSGRVAGILVHPTNPDTAYVLTSGGGLWKTTQFTHTNPSWTPTTDALISTSGGAAALGRNPNTIYLGIGDAFDVEGLIAGVVVTSTDGGKSWSPFANLAGASSVRDLKVDAGTAADTVLVTTDIGVFRSVDGGASFSQVLALPAWSLAQTSQGWLVSVLTDGDPLFGAGALYRSTDHGATWQAVAGAPGGNGAQDVGAGRMTLAVAAPGDAVVYALSGLPQGDAQDNIYRSADGGLSWTALGVNGSRAPLNPNCQQPFLDLLGGQAWYNQALVVDPTDAARNTVYAGGQLSSARSTDGGHSWSLVSIWLPGVCPDGSDAKVPYVHADFHAATISRVGGSPVLIYGTDGGLAVSRDGGNSFDLSANRGLVTHLTQTVVSSSQHWFNVLTGLQDDGTRLRVGGNSMVWNQVTGGDGEGAGWSQANDAWALSSVPGSFFFHYANPAANPQPGVWSDASQGIVGLDYYPFFTPLASPTASADPTGLTFFTSTGSKVYRTVDGGNSWQAIFAAGSARRPIQVFNLTHFVIGVHPTDPRRIAMAGTAGRVFITTDGGANWTTQQAKSASNHYPGINVTPSWASNGTLYIGSAYGGIGRPRVAKSVDGGNTWTAAANGLPDVPLSALLADPRDPNGNTVYASTWIGVYVTYDGGANWALLGAGLPNVWARGLSISASGLLRVATYGRGLWEIQL